MWPFGKKTVRQRRLEVRKTLPAGPSWLARWFGRPGAISALVILVIFAAFVAALALWPPNPLPYREGQYVAEPIRARVSFRILDEQRLTDAQEKAASSVPATFQINSTAPNTTVLDEWIARLEKIPSMLETAGSPGKAEPALLRQLDLLPPTEKLKEAKDKQTKADALEAQAKKVAEGDAENAEANAEKLREEAQTLRKEAETLLAEATPVQDANQAAYEAWVALAKPEARATLTEDLRELRSAMERIYVVRPQQVAEQIERAASHVKLVDGQSVTQQRVVDLIGQDETAALREQARDAVGRRF
ncbi:MAG: hypothetical protein KGY81_10790, partial [Phycisphaerae bacterium]|nr:hypothetical protein [Phycisphaerae bacterium]